MHILAFTLHFTASRRVIQLGLLSGLLGGLVLALGGGRRTAGVLGGLLIALAFGLVILAVHFGASPFRHHG